ncbi:MAG: hypothetical protein NDI84_05635 [Steroidobacteraceae bacterium]|nr:hypothetical protein [Steroidobacteraceae bacterium]
MDRTSSRTAALLALLALQGCRDAGTPDAWLGEIIPVASPAGAGSRYPHLGSGAGLTVLSWLQAQPGGGYTLQHARWHAGAWTAPVDVVNGTDWFINWADFPSVTPITATTWAAHWLQQKAGSVYAYDVRIAMSTDAGATWTAAATPHDDGTPTEHGFVTLFAATGGARAVWLDGRHTAGGHAHESSGNGAMTLRSTVVGADGRPVGSGEEIDARVCDCCGTDAAVTADGPVLVYRDRSEREVRDIALVRSVHGQWSAPVRVHADEWTIDACPVNGPAIDARGRTVVVAWFTAPDVPRVRLAFSHDAGRSFAPPIEVASGDPVGRVDVVLLEDGRAIASWLQQTTAGAQIRAQPFDRDGAAGPAVVIADTSVQRSSGFPQMAHAGDGLLFAWTDASDPSQVRTAYATLR